MDTKDWELNKDFKKWWREFGYHYEPETDEESDWVNMVRYWAWKSYKEGRSWML